MNGAGSMIPRFLLSCLKKTALYKPARFFLFLHSLFHLSSDDSRGGFGDFQFGIAHFSALFTR